MAHYWTADDNEVARKAQIADWIEDLIEFGVTVVAEALKDWRQTESRRPTIAQIRNRCIALQQQARERGLRIEDRRAPWPGWLRDIWGDDAQLERMDALATQKARYLRGEFFRGVPPDVIAAVSIAELRQRWPDEPGEVVSRAFDLIAETMDRRRERFHQQREAAE